ncbi:hypothetical protein AVEN_9156-1, partial [Araneus ventricosus]
LLDGVRTHGLLVHVSSRRYLGPAEEEPAAAEGLRPLPLRDRRLPVLADSQRNARRLCAGGTTKVQHLRKRKRFS